MNADNTSHRPIYEGAVVALVQGKIEALESRVERGRITADYAAPIIGALRTVITGLNYIASVTEPEQEAEESPNSFFVVGHPSGYWEVRDGGNLNRIVETYSDFWAAKGHADRQNELHKP